MGLLDAIGTTVLSVCFGVFEDERFFTPDLPAALSATFLPFLAGFSSSPVAAEDDDFPLLPEPRRRMAEPCFPELANTLAFQIGAPPAHQF